MHVDTASRSLFGVIKYEFANVLNTSLGARRGGGHLPPPWIWKNDVMLPSYKIPKISLAPSALAIVTLYFNLKRRKNFVCAFGAPKWGRFFVRSAEMGSIFCTTRRKRVNFFKWWWFCPPLEKFLRAPMLPTPLAAVTNSSEYRHAWRRSRVISWVHIHHVNFYLTNFFHIAHIQLN